LKIEGNVGNVRHVSPVPPSPNIQGTHTQLTDITYPHYGKGFPGDLH
jgi:hypothetical protein